MPPRGQHGVELPASNTDSNGRSRSAPRESPGSGYGITPGAVAGYYGNPNNDPGNNFRPGYYANNPSQPVADAGNAAYMAAAVAQQQRIQHLRDQATQYAKVYLDRAKQLELSSRTGGMTMHGKGILNYLGIDVSTPKGRMLASQTAQRYRQLAMNSGVGADGNLDGANAIVQFEHQSRKAINAGAHQQMHAAFQNEHAMNSFVGRAAYSFGASPSGSLVKEVTDPFRQGFRAAEYAGTHSDKPFWQSLGDTSRAFLGGLGQSKTGKFWGADNLGNAIQNKASMQAVQKTNSDAKIAALVRSGQLPEGAVSGLGQLATGHLTGKFGQKFQSASPWKAPEINITDVATLGLDRVAAQAVGGLGELTGLGLNRDQLNSLLNEGPHLNPATAAEFGLNFGTDPTSALGGGTGGDLFDRGARDAAAAAERAGVMDAVAKDAFVKDFLENRITSTAVGKSLLDQATHTIMKSGFTNPTQAARWLGKDVPRSVVVEAMKAGKNGGEADVQKVLAKAFAKGAWRPHSGMLDRAARATGHYTGAARPVSGALAQSLRDVLGKSKAGEDIVHGAEHTPTSITDEALAAAKAESGAAHDTAHAAGKASTHKFEPVPTPGEGERVVFHGERAGQPTEGGQRWFMGDTVHPKTGEVLQSGRAYAEKQAGVDGKVYATTIPNEAYDALRQQAAQSGEVGALLGPARSNAAVHVGMGADAYDLSAATEAEKKVVEQVKRETAYLAQSKGGLRAPLEAMNVDDMLDLSMGQASRINGQWAGEFIAAHSRGAQELVGTAADRAVYLANEAERLGSPGFAGAVEDALAPLRQKAFGKMSPGLQQLVQHRIDKLEAVLDVLNGNAGQDAKSIVQDQMERKWSTTGRTVAEEAAAQVKTKVGQQVLKPKTYLDTPPELVADVLADLPEDSLAHKALKDGLSAELAGAKRGTYEWGKVVAAIDRVASNPQVMESVARQVELDGQRDALRQLLIDSALHADRTFMQGSAIFGRIARAGGTALLAFMEKRPLTMLHTLSSPFEQTNQDAVTDYFDRMGGLMHLSAAERDALGSRAQHAAAVIARGGSPKEAIQVYSDMVHLWFEKAGLPKDVADDFAKDTIKNAKNTTQVFGIDDAGEMVKKPFVASQAQTTFKLDPNDIAVKIREELARRGDAWATVRVSYDAVKNHTLISMGKDGATYTIGDGLKGIENFWKVMITTRAYAPLIGFGAGVAQGINQGDDLWDAVAKGGEGAAEGVLIGASGLLRYRARNWIQARISAVLAHGFTSEETIPALSRILMRFQKPEFGAGANVLMSDNGDGFFINAGLSRDSGRSWEVFARTPKNTKEFVQSYSRIINAQVNPETDQMMLFVLQRRAGIITDDSFNAQVKEWLATDAGKDWKQKMAGMGIKNQRTAVNRYKQWTDKYVDPELARLRISPAHLGPGKDIPDELLRENADRLPAAIHRQVTGSVFSKHGIGGIHKVWSNYVQRAAYDAPAMKGAQRAFYNAEVSRLESRFIAGGMSAEEAVANAGELAVRHTQDIMFRIENTSRFSSKIDFISPFQGHREFNTKTWLRLASESPGRTARYGIKAAEAFNAGKNAGIFQQDPTSGQWGFTVPGSGPLSRALFGSPAGTGEMKVDLAGFLAMSEGGLSPDGNSTTLWSLATSAVPRPGGPFWAMAAGEFAQHFPDTVKTLPPGLRSLVFGPIGPSTRFLPADTDRLWQAIAGTPPPWNLLDEQEQKNDTNKYMLEIARQQIADHRMADERAGRPVDMAWTPSDKQVHDGLSSFFLAWSFMRGVTPASPHPVFRDHEQANQAFHHFVVLQSRGSGMTPDEYQKLNYNALKNAFVNGDRKLGIHGHPAFAPFFDASTKYVGPDDMRDWEKPFTSLENSTLQKQTNQRVELSWPEVKKRMADARKLHAALDEMHNIERMPGDKYAREAAMVQWRQDHPEEAKYLHSHYQAEKELAVIIHDYPKGDVRDRAIDRWRHMYAPPGQRSWTHSQMASMANDIRQKGGLVYNPYSEARDGEVVYADTLKSIGRLTKANPLPNTLAAIGYVRGHLSPMEQIRFWTEAAMHLSYTSGSTEDAQKVGSAYSIYTNEVRLIYANHPELHQYMKKDSSAAAAMVANGSIAPGDPGGVGAANKAQSDWTTGQSNATTLLYAEINAAKASEKAAYNNKQYAASKMLSNRIKELYLQVNKVKNDAWSGSGIGMRDQSKMHEAVREITYLHDIGGISDHQYLIRLERANQNDAHNVRFLPSNEEHHFLAMPASVRAAYLDNLVHKLDIPPGESAARYAIDNKNPNTDPFAVDNEGVPIKTYWSYLSNFQQDQLKKFVPQQVWQGWEAQDPSMEKGGGKGGKGKGGRITAGMDALTGANALKFAFDLMRSYSKRAGMAKPADYDAYLALPNSLAARNQFLDTHPDVAAYVAAGPMANMPPYYAMMVQQIMIRQGKWTGDVLDTTAMSDLAFARTQLDTWSRRGGQKAPDTYDLWVNMPSGQAKADFLQAHPEVRNWLQLGPMANMPDQYREVVRDIMLRYHQWTAESPDPLATTISNYYKTPGWARQQYLQDHPELTAYWQATQSPEQAAMADLTNQYYSIPDPGARSNFLSSHPELQQHLLDARTNRYERFLNQVAVYMGQDPALFQHYLDDQTAVLKDLLAKFAEPSLAPEGHWMAAPKGALKSSESGRQRA